MKRSVYTVFAVFLLTVLFSCQKFKTANRMPGRWQVSEIAYVYTDTTLITLPPDQQWEFNGWQYVFYDQGIPKEEGTYAVNFAGTRILFNNENGTNFMEVLEENGTHMVWRTRKFTGGMRLVIQLNKIQ